MPEYQTVQARQLTSPSTGRSQRADFKRPKLDVLLVKFRGQKAYLHYPGFVGELPTDGTVFSPAAFAGSYRTIPNGTMLVARKKLDFGQPLSTPITYAADGPQLVHLTPKP